jgi:homogentisate 1,2-dioxygenase
LSGFDNTSETVRTSAVATTLTNNDYDLYIAAQAGNIVVTGPSGALSIPGRTYSVTKDGAAFTVTLTPAAGLINGAATLVLAASAFHGAVIVNDGTNWIAKALY